MQVVVLMGGRGERLSGITAGLSKAMVDIQGKPFFYYQLQLMAAAGLNKFVFCVGYQGEAKNLISRMAASMELISGICRMAICLWGQPARLEMPSRF